MANDNKEIGDIVKKCKILLLDIEGTTTSISFVKDKLFPYAEENVKQFLDSQWETDDVKEVVAALRKLALEDQEKSVDGVVAIPGEDASKEDQIEGLVNNVKWQMSSDRKEGALKQLQGLIWKQGYDSGDIKGHVYDDVSVALEQWRSVDGRRVYIYSSGSVQAQRLLFGRSSAGDLLPYIDGHFDTAVGGKQDAASYTAIADKIGVQPADVLFLTDIAKEGEAARSAGCHVALVSREGNAPLPADATEAFPLLRSLAQLTASNKRKTDPQDELPAKVPKTNSEDDVKTASASESIISDDKVSEKTIPVEEEKMEVEESPVVEKVAEKSNDKEPAAATETIIEDVTNSTEILDVPMVEVEPVIIEANGEKIDMDSKSENKEATKIVVDGTKPDEVTKQNAVVTESDDVVTKPEVTKEDEVATKVEEVSGSSEVKPPSESKENVETKPVENKDDKTNDNDEKDASVELKEQIETQVVKETAQIAEATPPTVVTEIEEITVENLGDVAEMIEDLQPIVEEPPNEDMEDLQNVGEVLEKECDEILSKVQDVTNLDSIPLKPLLNTIAEETMETELDAENMDSNDIVDRILDTELELEMKQCNDIDLNSVTVISDVAKVDETGDAKIVEENKIELKTKSKLEEKVTENDKEVSSVPQSMDTESSQQESKTEENVKNNDKIESNNETPEIIEKEKIVENNEEVKKNHDTASNDKGVCTEDKGQCTEKIAVKEKVDKIEDNEQNADKMDTNDKLASKDASETPDKVETPDKTNNVVEEKQLPKAEESKAQPAENVQPETTDKEMVTEEASIESEKDKETQVNGKARNGDAETVNVNGDASNEEELKSRLSVENGKEPVNGSNGDSVDSEKGQGDKMEAEVSDIKVKTVATEEPRTDPIEQPTEA